jgi:hypothetical protein
VAPPAFSPSTRCTLTLQIGLEVYTHPTERGRLAFNDGACGPLRGLLNRPGNLGDSVL